MSKNAKQEWPYNDPWVMHSKKRFVQNSQLVFLNRSLLSWLIFIPNVHSILWAFIQTIMAYFYYKKASTYTENSLIISRTDGVVNTQFAFFFVGLFMAIILSLLVHKV